MNVHFVRVLRNVMLLALAGGLTVMTMSGSCSISPAGEQQMNITGQRGEKVEVMNRMSLKENLEMMRKFFFEKGEKVPVVPLPQKQAQLLELFDGRPDGLRSVWLGHSTLLINIDGHRILTDPVFERKVTLVGPARFNRELALNVDALPQMDTVIISHDHYDHLNRYSVRKLIGRTSKFVVPARVGERLVKWGVPRGMIVELDWWEECSPVEGLTIAAAPSQHFSGRGMFDRNRTLWASWVIRTAHHNVFFSGDTGYFPGFKEIGRQYGPFDVAYLECGAYNEAWSNVHMFPEQAVQAFIDLGGRVLQPVHWAAFNLAFHPWYEPIERLTEEAWRRGVHVAAPMIGRIIDYHHPAPTDLWWLPAMKKSREGRELTELAVDFSR